MKKVYLFTIILFYLINTNVFGNTAEVFYEKQLVSNSNTQEIKINIYDKLPQKYTFEMAYKNGDVIRADFKSYNIEKLDKFIEEFKNKELSVGNILRITSFTIEGDAIIFELIVSKENVKLITDYTRDKWASPANKKIKEYIVVDFLKKKVKEGTSYFVKTDKGTEEFLIFAKDKI